MASEDALQRVSLNIAELLRDRMQRQDVSFSFVPPQTSPTNNVPRLNIYLFQMNENPALRNEEDPRRAIAGQYGAPPLALELSYLFTSYGQANRVPIPEGFPTIQPDSLSDLDAQWILADAMRVLHDHPIISRNTLRQRPPIGPLLDPQLQFEFESLRITPRDLNLDELTKLWTAFKEDFHRSVAYDVSIIRVEQARPQVARPPVLTRGIPVQPSTVLGPVLMALEPDSVAPGELVTLTGEGLGDPTLEVVVSDAAGTGFPATTQTLAVVRGPQGVQFSIPNDPLLYMPGPKLVQVRITAAPGHTRTSNGLILSLLPALTALSQNSGPFDGTVSLTITGALLGVRPIVGVPSNPLAPSVLFGSYAIPTSDLDLTGLPTKIVAHLSAPVPNDPNGPKVGQVLPVRARANGVESRSWRENPVTKMLEMDPSILFRVT